MSAPRRVRFTPQAERDLDDITLFSLGRFGALQTEHYLNRLDEAIDLLATHPESSTLEPHIGPRIRSKPAVSHVVYYRLDGDVVIVLRIVHSRMQFNPEDLPIHFPE